MLRRFLRASFFRCRGLERTSRCLNVLFRACILTLPTFSCMVCIVYTADVVILSTFVNELAEVMEVQYVIGA